MGGGLFGARLSAPPRPSLWQLDGWVAEKEALMAGEAPRDKDAPSWKQPPPAPKRWLRHRTFTAELAQNKEWLHKIEKVGAGGARLGVRLAGEERPPSPPAG